MPGNAAERQRRPGSGEHEGDHQQRPHHQQQQVLQLESALVLAGGRDEIADSGEDDGRRLAAGQQVEQQGNPGGQQPQQGPGMEEADHPPGESGARASRSTVPYGVSVVTRW
jgi:hypothetical protein